MAGLGDLLRAGAVVLAAVIVLYIFGLRAERDTAKAEVEELTLKIETQEQAITALQNHKQAADIALNEWKEKNEQAKRDLAAARKATVKAALADSDFNTWGAAALPGAIVNERLLQNQICGDPAPTN